MTKSKTVMPKEGISKKIGANIEVKLLKDFDSFSNGSMLMTMTECKISDPTTKEELGKIRFEMNGTAVQALIGRRSWMISIRELWPIFAEADAQYVKKEP